MGQVAVVLHEASAIAPRAAQLLRPIAAPAEVIAAQNEVRAMVHNALKEGRDFGVIPGTDKSTLLKPGAERVALAMGCYYGDIEFIEKEVDHDRPVPWVKQRWVKCDKPEGWKELRAAGLGRNKQFNGTWVWQQREEERGESIGLYRYVIRVPVINRQTGEVVGSGVGACSSMESKYIDRPRDSENTVLKMAHKRAIVAACLLTFGLSDEFTQDVEDLETGEGQAPGDSAPTGTRPSSPRLVPATDEQKARIEQLLETADLDDAGKEKVRSNIPAYTATRAIDAIAYLEKLQPPADVAELEAEGEQRADPSTPSTTTTSSSASSTASGTGAAPKKAPEKKSGGLAALAKKMDELLHHENLTAAERENWLKRSDGVRTEAELLELVEQLEKVVQFPV